jgi:hypothetical protein
MHKEFKSHLEAWQKVNINPTNSRKSCLTFAWTWAYKNGGEGLSHIVYKNENEIKKELKKHGIKEPHQILDKTYTRIDEPKNNCIIQLKSNDYLPAFGIYLNGVAYGVNAFTNRIGEHDKSLTIRSWAWQV